MDTETTEKKLLPGTLTLDRSPYGEARCWMVVSYQELVAGVWTERRENFIWTPITHGNDYAAGIGRAILSGYAELENYVTAAWRRQQPDDQTR